MASEWVGVSCSVCICSLLLRLLQTGLPCSPPKHRAAFGILEWGGCGYTNGDGSMPVPKEEATAYSDDNEDWGGSCGRCYEVRCPSGAHAAADPRH